jgi:hypothetical protein
MFLFISVSFFACGTVLTATLLPAQPPPPNTVVFRLWVAIGVLKEHLVLLASAATFDTPSLAVQLALPYEEHQEEQDE